MRSKGQSQHHCTFPDEARRKAEAAERLAEWQKLTPAQQIADLDKRLGPGVGAVKQRARLHKSG